MPATRRARSTAQTDDRIKRKLSANTAESPKKKMVKKEIKESPDKLVKKEIVSDSDMSDIENEEMDILRRQEENMKMNEEFLKNLGVEETKLEMSAQKKKPATSRGLKREKVPKEILPRRSSLRLQNKTPDGTELPPEALIERAARFTSYEPTDLHERPPAGPLTMSEILHTTTSTEEHSQMLNIVSQLDTKPIKPSTIDLERYIQQVQKLKIRDKLIAKVVPERSFSVALHPAASRVLAATGDKWGKLGLWDVVSENSAASDGVCCYKPHSRPITCLLFPVDTPEKLYSCSYDGSLRCGDFGKEVFDEIYSVPEDEDVLLRNFSFTSPHTMLVSQNDGCVALADTRTEGVSAEQIYMLHQRSLRTVSVHPTEPHYFCTAGVEGVIRVWDLRNLKQKGSSSLCDLHVTRSINSAYFSPLTGKYILSTSMDDRLTIFDSSIVGSGIKMKKSIRHNCHTGRWLTGFRADWHPAREDVLVVGSMNRPREIAMYSDDGKKIHAFYNEECLGSVTSLNALHPTRDLVVGANSSGRLHVFM